VYLVEKDQRIDQVILPIRGKGAWSTMYAYVALDGDFNTIRGISFYEHGETPGLGGEIENKRWLEGWQGKQVYGPDQTVALRVVKGQAAENEPQAAYQIDGLSGATVTGAGVSNLLRFWFGDHGFKPFLNTMRRQEDTMADRKRDLLLRSIIERNPIALLVLGICSALAVTSKMQTAW
jgi:Na+-transporting NADH:ubiquinone oxidoreductase subunit C